MTSNAEVDKADVTWKSEIDVVKDLALLNDFGDPGDTEPFKILYSIGRGIKIKDRQKSQQNFIDSRTGEVIDLSDLNFETNSSLKKGQGRGGLLNTSSNTEFQLQEQLRLARPLGSGDEAIESYCRRNRQCEYSVSTSDSDPNSQKEGAPLKSLECVVETQKQEPKIKKGYRNSNLHNNALMSNLLYKPKGNCNAELTTKMKNLFFDTEDTDTDNSSKNTDDNNSDGSSQESDEHNIREPKKLGGACEKLRDIIDKSTETEIQNFSHKCTISTPANSPSQQLASSASNVLYFVQSDTDFPCLPICKKTQF